MANDNDLLLEARDLGIHLLPEQGDAGDRRVRARLDNVIDNNAGRSRRTRAGRLRLTPVIGVSVFAALVATATATVLGLSAASLFRVDPQQTRSDARFLHQIGVVAPSTVRLVAQTNVPDYGQVQFWGAATTRHGGFCFALKLPNGAWGGYPRSSQAAYQREGWDGGTTPGCFITRRQASIKYGEPAAPLEAWEADLQSKDGKHWTIYYGYVQARGRAATVSDPRTGHSARVTRGGYYILVDPTPTIAQAGLGPAGSDALCEGCYLGDLQVLDAAGNRLKPDYTPALRGHQPGSPTAGSGGA